MEKAWQRYLQLKVYHQLEWSEKSRLLLQKMPDVDPRLGSPSFLKLWAIEKKKKSSQELLQLVLDLLQLPELVGTLQQTQALMAGIWPQLAPDSPFWREIAELVDRTFPEDALSIKTSFARQIHQLRYVISCHQAQYVRDHYRRDGMTDADALALYLSNRPFSLESARLHNKIAYQNGKARYLEGKQSYNIKVLQYFHTEFILDNQGNFLNEVDAEGQREAGIVNGASFNYAKKNNNRHWQLDVTPIAIHDPIFRKEVLVPYRAPTLNEYRSFLKPYGNGYRSCSSLVKKESKAFGRKVKKSQSFFRKFGL
ncbi:DUF3114 domain-containing protein [Streptococcus plurextorum]|uniref:DUF3114 domain-containing protein n=1 Tax=Streptococcus plurextorum TaxID=456876 RepID=UPI0004273490|nr:DUF3114 domain-containing protein [Streptococcus plurextorum]